jgi:glycosyltransferase involved in cell wall biosynthesis
VKLAFVFPPMLVGGRALDFRNLWDDPRGTSGTEIQALRIPDEMKARGHDVFLYVESPNASHYGKHDVPLREVSRLASEFMGYDTIVVNVDVNFAFHMRGGPIRVLWQQINDHRFGIPGYDEQIDFYVSPSRMHIRSMTDPTVRPEMPALGGWTAPEKWELVPNGVVLEDYRTDEKILGRCVYISSPDRGLHLVLKVWPQIKRAVPYATLRIFHHHLKAWIDGWRGKVASEIRIGPPHHDWLVENMLRAQYIEKALPMLKSMGVSYEGPVSRNQMCQELSEAQVLAFPCDTIAFTENFPCSVLEACASGALPVISKCDSLEDVFGGTCPMVDVPARQNLRQWTDMVVCALKDSSWANGWRQNARAFAESHTWPMAAEKFEQALVRRMAP